MYLKGKRIVSFIMALLLIVVTSPVMLLVALAIKIEDFKGPILFKQERPGKDEKIFKIYKFRTMKTQLEDINGRALSDFERLTKVGRILRKTSLDELPQFFNVLKGDMSFIGPRPLLVQYLPYYNERQHKRHNVRPGISGWAQVNGRNSIDWEEKFELDVWYVEHVSLALDLKIVGMTIRKIIAQKDINHSNQDTMPFFGA